MEHKRLSDSAAEGDGADGKRRRYEGGIGGYAGSYAPNTTPSRVIHVKNLADGVTAADLSTALGRFGTITYVLMIARRRQALVEFQTVEDSQRCVSMSQASPIFISGYKCDFEYSRSQEIDRSRVQEVPPTSAPPGKVLLFTILNALHRISPEVIHTICAPIAAPLRVVMIRKNGVQALAEYASVDQATAVKQQLNGNHIYTGCCELRIDFSKCDRVNVKFNGEETRDFTEQGKLLPDYNPHMHGPPGGQRYPPPHDPYAPRGGYYGGGGGGGGGPYGHGYGGGGYGGPPPPHYGGDPYGGYYGGGGGGYGPRGPPGYQGEHYPPGPGGPPGKMYTSVVMIYGLNESFNCAKLFNLACLFGNVARIKFILSRPGMAMVQMCDTFGAGALVQYMNGAELYGTRLELKFSKQGEIRGFSRDNMPDGSPVQVEYAQSTFNRFPFEGGPGKNRVCAPSNVLHYFNCPMGLTTETLNDLFVRHGAKAPTAVAPFRRPDAKTETGLASWESTSDALEALLSANHCEFYGTDGRMAVLKLCFSTQQMPTHAAT